MRIKEAAKLIEDEFSHEHYGWGLVLSRPVKREGDEFYIKYEADVKNYDCLNAAVKAKDILHEKGMESDAYEGKDEHEVWDKHVFLVTENDITIDATPQYQTINAEHTPHGKIKDNELVIPERLKLEVGKLIPVSYNQESSNCYTISRIGIMSGAIPSHVKIGERLHASPVKTVVYEVLEVSEGKPTRSYVKTFDIKKGVVEEEYLSKGNKTNEVFEDLKIISKRDDDITSAFVKNVKKII